jgi:hypothetical protein
VAYFFGRLLRGVYFYGFAQCIQDMHKGMRSSVDAKLLFANIADDPRLVINGAGSRSTRSVVPVAEMAAMGDQAMVARLAALD